MCFLLAVVTQPKTSKHTVMHAIDDPMHQTTDGSTLYVLRHRTQLLYKFKQLFNFSCVKQRKVVITGLLHTPAGATWDLRLNAEVRLAIESFFFVAPTSRA